MNRKLCGHVTSRVYFDVVDGFGRSNSLGVRPALCSPLPDTLDDAKERRFALPSLGPPTFDLFWPRLRPGVDPLSHLFLFLSPTLLFGRVELPDYPSDLGDRYSSPIRNLGHRASFGSKLADLGYRSILMA